MADLPPEIHSWYTKSPKEFRSDLLNWFSNRSSGGELGRLFSDFSRQRSGLRSQIIKSVDSKTVISVFSRQRSGLRSQIIKSVDSKTVKGVAIVLVVTSIGVLIKGEPHIPIYETIFDNLESIALGSAGIIFLLEIKDRQKRDHYEAWQVINSAQGQTGSGGRIQALEDLNRDGVDLEGVAAPGADLSGIDLRGANLKRANFSNVQLDEASLQRADLQGTNLKGADLLWANLQGADLSLTNLQEACLSLANLQETSLQEANLQGAFLVMADLQGANLWEANLQRAHLRDANLQEAHLWHANLQGAHLENANLKGADLSWANLQGTEHLTQDQLSKAILCCTILPNNINLNPNRDCEEMGIDPETGEYID